ncbi:unnamed protein product [Durusdinium trenchii]|uniref:RWD domain-containing protein n=1 Tax=Durusdinium trenchii TaxID=1381693 RepID=A0ABP0J5S6_9DINO
MPLSEEASDELEALEGIFGSDFHWDGSKLNLNVAPEEDSEGFRYASVQLLVELPDGYPATEGPSVQIQPEEGDLDLSQLHDVVKNAAADAAGSVALFMVAEAVRDWLREFGRMERIPEPEDKDIGIEDDFDVDSEDLDGELIDALLEVLKGDAARCKELKRIRRMGAVEQKVALRAQLKMLSPEEREALVGSDSESDQEEEVQAPSVKLAPAQIECSAGHELTAFSARPPDYRKFDGDEYTCDVCGQDGEYRYGVYHCTKCFQQGLG